MKITRRSRSSLLVFVISIFFVGLAFLVFLEFKNRGDSGKIGYTETIDKNNGDYSSNKQQDDYLPTAEKIPIDANINLEGSNSSGSEAYVIINGRFLTKDGNPISDVEVKSVPQYNSIKTYSGKEGHFTFNLITNTRREYVWINLNMTRQGFSYISKAIKCEYGKIIKMGNIYLEAGGAISGKIYNNLGKPIQYASVICTQADLHNADIEAARIEGPEFTKVYAKGSSEFDGSYYIEGVPVGRVRIWATIDDYQYLFSISDPVDVVASTETYGVDLILEPTPNDNLIGGFIQNSQGDPISKAKISLLERKGSFGFQADKNGKFIRKVKEKGKYTVIAHDPVGKYGSVTANGIESGTINLIMTLKDLRQASLKIRGRDGEIPKKCFVSVSTICENINESNQWNIPTGENIQPLDGVVVMSVPEQQFSLRISAEGYRVKEMGPFDPENIASNIDVILERASYIRGVVMIDDKCANGVKVTLHRNYNTFNQGLVRHEKINGFLSRSGRNEIVRTITNEDGRFKIKVNNEGSYFLQAKRRGYSKAEKGPVVVESGKSIDDIVIDLEKGGSIEGKIINYQKNIKDEIIVAASRGDGFPLYTKIDENGMYKFDFLTPGKWKVKISENIKYFNNHIHYETVESPQMTIPWNCNVINGEVTRFDIDLAENKSCWLVCVILIDKMVPKGWKIWLFKEDQSGQTNVIEDIRTDGKIRLSVEREGLYRVKLFGPTGAGPYLYIQDYINLAPGENKWNCQINSGQLEINSGNYRQGKEMIWKYNWNGYNNLSAHINFEIGQNGSTILPIVPAGNGIITGRVFNDNSNTSSEVFKRDIFINEGEFHKINMDGN